MSLPKILEGQDQFLRLGKTRDLRGETMPDYRMTRASQFRHPKQPLRLGFCATVSDLLVSSEHVGAMSNFSDNPTNQAVEDRGL